MTNSPFSELETCPVCSESRYWLSESHSSRRREKKPQLKSHTIPIGSQLQALYKIPKVHLMPIISIKNENTPYLEIAESSCRDEYSDVLYGTDMIEPQNLSLCGREGECCRIFKLFKPGPITVSAQCQH